MNKRRAPRATVENFVMLTGQSGTRSGVVFNLSSSGCALESGEPIEPNTTLQLDLIIPNDKNPVRVNRARVTWKAGSDMGVEFVNMNETAKVRLERYLESLPIKAPKKGKA